jgi:polyisoprenoid-binding protein YceI
MRVFRNSLVGLALLLALAVTSVAQAAPTTWTIDPVHSQVGFSIRHFFSKVPGNFTKFSGTIVYDPDKPDASTTKVEIDATSINTENEKRDTHLKSEDFFYTEKFPTLTFVSNKVVSAEKGKLTVQGDLTMRGVTKPVTLDVTFLGAGPTFQGEQRAGFEATAKVNRKDYNISWNRALDQGGTLLGDDVDIKIGIEATYRPAEAPAKAPAAAKS